MAADSNVISEGSDGVSDEIGWLHATRSTTAANSRKREIRPTSLSLAISITTILPYSHSIDSDRYQLK